MNSSYAHGTKIRTKILFCGRGLKPFSFLKKVSILNDTFTDIDFFLVQYSKKYRLTAVDHFRLDTLRITRTAF